MPPKYSLTVCMILAGLCYGEGGDIPFTRAGIASLKGKDICALQGEFPQGIGVYWITGKSMPWTIEFEMASFRSFY
jgi:hypothetical protein